MAKGPLALVGGAEWQPGCEFDKELLAAVSATEVLVVTAAAAYERPAEAFARAEEWFSSLGAKAVDAGILTRADAENSQLAERITAARMVYICDGSAMHLRSVLKDSAAISAIEAMWSAGGAVAGSSAGAMVLSDPMVDPRGGAFTLGLGFVRRMAAVPHWERWTPETSRRMQHLAPAGTVVAEIEERTALVRWGDGTWTTSGSGTVKLVLDEQPLDISQLGASVDA